MIGLHQPLLSPAASRARWQQWLKTPLGRLLVDAELQAINLTVPNLFGYHVLQIGELGDADLLENSRISHRVVQVPGPVSGSYQANRVIGSDQELPFAADSIDAVVMPHVLEFCSQPHKLLREVDRVLIADGSLILTGFNPVSCWGLWRLCLAWRGEPPWCGHFFRHARIRDWLSLLDFEVVQTDYLLFRPPLVRLQLLQRFSFLETVGARFVPGLSGVFVILARKRVLPVSPIKTRWHTRHKVVTPGLAEPSARYHDEIC